MRGRERGRQEGPDVPCLGPVGPTGQDSGTPCTAMKRTKNTAGSPIYTGSLCVGLGTLPALAPTLFLSKHQEEVREVKGWGDK